MNNEAKIMNMFYRSETKPRIRERLISRGISGRAAGREQGALCAGRGGRRRDNDVGPVCQTAWEPLCLVLQQRLESLPAKSEGHSKQPAKPAGAGKR